MDRKLVRTQHKETAPCEGLFHVHFRLFPLSALVRSLIPSLFEPEDWSLRNIHPRPLPFLCPVSTFL